MQRRCFSGFFELKIRINIFAAKIDINNKQTINKIQKTAIEID